MENKNENQLEKRLFYYIVMTMLILLIVFSVLTNVDKIRDYILIDSRDDIGKFIQAGVTIEQAWKNIEKNTIDAEDAEVYIWGNETDSSAIAKAQLVNMRTAYNVIDDIEEIESEKCLIACKKEYTLKELEQLEQFVLSGGNVFFAGMPQDAMLQDTYVQDLLGIRLYEGVEERDGIRLSARMTFDEVREYKEEINIPVFKLKKQTEVYAAALENNTTKEVQELSPLLWRYHRNESAGEVFVSADCLFASSIGNALICFFMEEVKEVYIYPVVNAYCFYVAGTPYVDNFSSEYLLAKYSRDAQGVQNDIFMTELRQCESKYQLTGTWYSPQKKEAETSEDAYIKYYVQSIKERGSVLGERNIDKNEMVVESLFNNNLIEWKPDFRFTDGEKIYLSYTEPEEENFEKTLLKDYSSARSMGYNAIYVDVLYYLKEEYQRDWLNMSINLETVLRNEQKKIDWLERVSAEKAIQRVYSFVSMQPEIEYKADCVDVKIGNFSGEAFFHLYTYKEIVGIENGTLEKIGENLYFLEATDKNIKIYLEQESDVRE